VWGGRISEIDISANPCMRMPGTKNESFDKDISLF
jgi:hypothetical protein